MFNNLKYKKIWEEYGIHKNTTQNTLGCFDFDFYTKLNDDYFTVGLVK